MQFCGISLNLFADARTIATPSPLNSSNPEPCRTLLVLAWLPHCLAHSSGPWAPVTDSKAGPRLWRSFFLLLSCVAKSLLSSATHMLIPLDPLVLFSFLSL